METNIQSEKPSAVTTFALLSLCTLAGAAGVVLFPAALLLPGLFAYAMFRTKPGFLALFSAATLAAAYALSEDLLQAACMTGLFALPALAIWLLQKKRVGNVYTCAAGAAGALLPLYGIVCLPGILSGEGAFAEVQRVADAVFSAYRALTASLPGMTGEAAAQWNAAIDLLQGSVASMVVPSLCALSCVLALSNLLFFRLFARKRNFGLAKLRPLSAWGLPRSMTGGLAFLLIASLILELTGWDYADSLGSTVNVIVGFPLVVQGFALLDFFLKRGRGNPALKRTLVYIPVALLFALVQTPLMVMGCFDMIFHIRERIAQGPTPTAQV